jgi:hypothetical protein
MPFHQVEAICSAEGLHYYLTNEKLVQGFTIPAQWHLWDATEFLVTDTAVVNVSKQSWDNLKLFPNPVSEVFVVSGIPNWRPIPWRLFNEQGVLCDKGMIWDDAFGYSMLHLAKGTYTLRLGNLRTFKIMHH